MPSCAAKIFRPGLQRASVKLKPGLGMHCGFSKRTDFPTAAPQSHLQALYDAAKQTFRQGRDISTAEIDSVSQLLAAVPLEEMGLEEQAVAATQQASEEQGLLGRLGRRSSSRLPVITYLHICENDKFGMGVFCIPGGTNIALHDHPQMTVFSRILYGSMRVKGYDWIPGGKPSTAVGNPQPARLTIHEDIEEGDPPIVIRPTSGGNIHSFIAKSSCAILDLLAPPYDLSHPDKGCTYYKEASDVQADGTVMLEKMPDPDDIIFENKSYSGIQVE